ncbi:helix-turn-helix domain-containing protein [Streptomyces acidicola]|uniref:helix-turn-helix domain-containing protein n=1 Tax=Streptomyces acidicola TaxID=2596892 RepID=UPI0037A461CB
MSGTRLTGETRTRTRTRTRAAKLYLAGCTIEPVARQIGRSYGTARTLLLEAGVKLRKPGGHQSTSFRAAN